MKTTVAFTNQAAVGEDGWGMLAPWGDFPGHALLDGGPVPALQRIDRDAGARLVQSLRSFTGRAARFFREVPIFRGHPDVPALANQASDPQPKGAVADIQVREDGVYIRPAFNDAGAALLNGEERLGFSAYWDAEAVGVHGDQQIYRPVRLRSVALTPVPNLPVQMLNDASASAAAAAASKKTGDLPNAQNMDRTKLIAALIAAGASLAADANDDTVLGAVNDLGKRAGSVTSLANEKAAVDTKLANAQAEAADLKTKLTAAEEKAKTAETTLANERTARVTDLLEGAIQTGRITPAEKPTWERRLKADFANEAPALAALEPKVKLAGMANGERKAGEKDPNKAEPRGRARAVAALEAEEAKGKA